MDSKARTKARTMKYACVQMGFSTQELRAIHYSLMKEGIYVEATYGEVIRFIHQAVQDHLSKAVDEVSKEQKLDRNLL